MTSRKISALGEAGQLKLKLAIKVDTMVERTDRSTFRRLPHEEVMANGQWSHKVGEEMRKSTTVLDFM